HTHTHHHTHTHTPSLSLSLSHTHTHTRHHHHSPGELLFPVTHTRPVSLRPVCHTSTHLTQTLVTHTHNLHTHTHTHTLHETITHLTKPSHTSRNRHTIIHC